MRHETADAANSRGSLQQVRGGSLFWENVVNPTNVGAIFRSAAALHMDAVLLTPGCRQFRCIRRAMRVSMGTVFQDALDDISGKRKMAGRWHGKLQQLGFKTAGHGIAK